MLSVSDLELCSWPGKNTPVCWFASVFAICRERKEFLLLPFFFFLLFFLLYPPKPAQLLPRCCLLQTTSLIKEPISSQGFVIVSVRFCYHQARGGTDPCWQHKWPLVTLVTVKSCLGAGSICKRQPCWVQEKAAGAADSWYLCTMLLVPLVVSQEGFYFFLLAKKRAF